MKFIKIQKNKGFTLIETLIAVFILTLALNGFFALISSSLFSARYAKNEITANYLLQEVVDYIKNDRDTIAFQNNNPASNDGWDNFLNKYVAGNCFGPLFSNDGCYFEPADVSFMPTACNAPADFGLLNCPVLNYDEEAINHDFYTYHTDGIKSNFKRQVLMSVNPNRSDELDVKVTVEWQNGNLVRSRYLIISLLNWQK